MRRFGKEIKNLADVKLYADYLHDVCNLAFHPDDDFKDYICMATGERSFSEVEAEENNNLMSDCFVICQNNSVDIYDFMGRN